MLFCLDAAEGRQKVEQNSKSDGREKVAIYMISFVVIVFLVTLLTFIVRYA